ncbi:hypothetical protein GUJ93_ZPchr0013g37669 [Zizania palustris]|uniref:Uncharacterized protein n=1 Tax=Zizania palustris TaxID=103762 RepID=A0A8J5X093_ZIZPA|nr:hypothetical protein GUJ93_ZPchr0013g37669 [Zizania palustris]
MGTYKCCFIFKRRFRWNDAPPPEDVCALFAQHSGGGPHMAADGLRRYLHATGHDSVDDADLDRLFDQIRLGRAARVPRVVRPLLALDDFHRFLFSHDLNPPIRQGQVHHDMAAPLSHYFIYTGHKSYLNRKKATPTSSTPAAEQVEGEGTHWRSSAGLRLSHHRRRGRAPL